MNAMKRFMLILLCFAMLLSTVACGGNTETENPPEENKGSETVDTPVTDEEVTYQETITIGVANDITTLDPQGSNTDANMMAFTLTHETLVEVDPETNEVIPGLAT